MRKFGALALAAVMVVSLAGCKSEGGVAVVDTARLYQESASGKAGIEHLQKMEAAMQEQLMKAQALLEKNPDDEALRTYFQTEFGGYQQLVETEQQKVVEGINKQMQEALEKSRKKGDFGAVLAKESVMAFAPKADITDSVLKNMDMSPLTFAPVELKKLTPPQGAKSGADKPADAAKADKPAADKPATDKPATDKPEMDKPADDKTDGKPAETQQK